MSPSRTSLPALVLGLALGLALGACRSSEPPAPPKYERVTKDEAAAFGEKFAALIEACEPTAIAAIWKMDVTVHRALAETEIRGSMRDGVAKGLDGEKLWRQQCADLGAEGNSKARFLSVRESSGDFRPLVRMTSDAGLNYAELELGRFPDGVFAVDAMYYHTGEALSKTLGRLVQMMLSADDLGDAVSVASTMKRIGELRASGDSEGALRLIDELPEPFRSEKSIMLMRVVLDSADNEARYLAAIDKFEKAFPNDPALDVVSIDGFAMRKQYDRYHATLDRLDKRIDDPYVDLLHAVGYQEQKDFDKAAFHASRATSREPTLQEGWDMLAELCTAKRDFACAVKALETLETKFALTLGDDVIAEIVAALTNGAELAASEDFKAWRARRAATPPPSDAKPADTKPADTKPADDAKP